MKKATINISKSKKGKTIIKLVFLDKKQMSFLGTIKDIETSEINNKEVDVKRVSGQVELIKYDGKIIYEKFKAKISVQNKNNKYSNNNKQNYQKRTPYKTNYATAPYNFISLNEEVVASSFNINTEPQDKFYTNKNTGYIDIEIENLTPIFIRDTADNTDKKEFRQINSDFYSPTNKYSIPGSSIRGMIRTLVEIFSYSNFEFYDNRNLYYRAFADKAINFRNEYKNTMTSPERKRGGSYKMSAGLMYKNGLDYYIIAGSFKQTKKQHGYRRFWFKELSKGRYLVVSGDMFNKKHEWIVEANINSSDIIKVPRNDIKSYKNDKQRATDVTNIVDKTKDNKYVPCFYVSWLDDNNNKRISFGHTPLFRLSYKKDIAAHIKQDKIKIDIPTAIFGNETDFAGRVSFEDAYLNENNSYEIKEEEIPKVLSNPNSTSFQLYLEQKENNNYNNTTNLKHYNSNNTKIRGTKLYWHKTNENYTQTEGIKEKVSTKIKPIKSGAIFNGKIRFQNLSDIELGALLLALELKKGLYHKIGMAKSLGLGTIKVTPKLFLSERKNRYENLLAEFKTIADVTDFSSYIPIFKTEILSKLNKNINDFWKLDRIKQLEIMLNFEKGNVLHKKNKIDYMELKQFRNREVVQHPDDLIECK